MKKLDFPVAHVLPFILFMLLIDVRFLHAQNSKLLLLPANEDVSKVAWRDSIYRFPEFQKGRITYKNGMSVDSEFKLNYNIYYERMDFINVSGDTLNLTDTKEIKLINFGDRSFYHNYTRGYFEILVPLPITLAVRKRFIFEDYQLDGSLYSGRGGTPGPGIVPESRGIPSAFHRLYRKESIYFFIDENNEIRQASRAMVLKLFPQHKEEIKAYLLINKVDFSAQKDMIELVNFCHQQELKMTHPDESIQLRAGESISSIGKNDRYRFPEFLEAKITNISGPPLDHRFKLNYNQFTGEMDFVNVSGDTIPLKSRQDILIVNLDGHVFYRDYYNGYVELIMQGPICLGERNILEMVGNTEGENQDDQDEAFRMRNKHKLIGDDRLYRKRTTYFFMDKKKHMHRCSKLSLYKLFPYHWEKIDAYITEKNISFDNGQELMDVLSFVNGLRPK